MTGHMAPFKNRIQLMFLLSISVPGIILGYLSFKTIKNEKTVLEKSLITHREDFLAFCERTIKKAEKEHLDQVKDLLIVSAHGRRVKNHFFVLTDLLSLPVIQSAVVYDKKNILLPPLPLNQSSKRMFLPEINPRLQSWVDNIQGFYQSQRYRECIRAIDYFLSNISERIIGPMGSPYQFGFKLLKLQCFKQLGWEKETLEYGQYLVNDFLEFKNIDNYREYQFYLKEILIALTSMENLPRDKRDEIWDILNRSETFFKNASYVYGSWKPKADFLFQIKGKVLTEGLEVLYIDREPYLKIKFPWIESRNQIVAKINQSLFFDLIENETTRLSGSPWSDISFSIFDMNNILLGGVSRAAVPAEGGVERILNTQYLPWKIMVFPHKDDGKLKLGQTKILLLYILLCFSFLALILGAFSIIRGISKEEKMIKMKGNFLSAITHELKTPLTSIRLLSEILGSDKTIPETKVKKYASLIGKESNRLHNMIENILNATRLDNEGYKLEQRPVNLKELLSEMTPLLHNAYQEKQLKLKVNIEGAPVVLGDKEALRSVFQNLLDNALKYSNSESTVQVNIEKKEAAVICEVIDEGIGMAPESLKYIFEKFYRAEDELTRKSKGTGLGLALVKQIMDQHEAEISVKSKLNKGSQFTLVFKNLPDVTESLPEEKIAENSPKNGN